MELFNVRRPGFLTVTGLIATALCLSALQATTEAVSWNVATASDVNSRTSSSGSAYNPHDGTVNDEKASREEEVAATNKPEILSKPVHIKVREGDSLSLPCDIHDLGDYVVLWRKGYSSIYFAGQTAVLKDKRFKLQRGGMLINDLKMSDSGNYSCQVSVPRTKDEVPVEVTHTVEVVDKTTVLETFTSNEVGTSSGDHSKHAGHGGQAGATTGTANCPKSNFALSSIFATFVTLFILCAPRN